MLASPSMNQRPSTISKRAEKHTQGIFKVFVGGLPADATEDLLFAYFQKFGSIISCQTKKWKSDDTKCKGFALLTLNNKQTFEKIVQTPHLWSGRRIECKKAITNKKALMKYNKKTVAQKIFVTGLPVNTTDEALGEYFKQFGAIEMAYVVKNYLKRTRIGFVCYKNKRDKERVLAMPQHKLLGAKIYAMNYQTKHDLQKDCPSPGETAAESPYFGEGCPENEECPDFILPFSSSEGLAYEEYEQDTLENADNGWYWDQHGENWQECQAPVSSFSIVGGSLLEPQPIATYVSQELQEQKYGPDMDQSQSKWIPLSEARLRDSESVHFSYLKSQHPAVGWIKARKELEEEENYRFNKMSTSPQVATGKSVAHLRTSDALGDGVFKKKSVQQLQLSSQTSLAHASKNYRMFHK